MGYFADQANNYSAPAQSVTAQQPIIRAERGMPDAIASGVVLGLMLAVIAIVVTLGRKLQANQSEGAKRLKLTIKLGALLLVGAVVVSAGADGFAIAAIIGVAYWIYKGFKKS